MDSHHYENESMGQIIKYFDDPVLRQMAESTTGGGVRAGSLIPPTVGFQDMNGRIIRYPLRKTEKTPGDRSRDVTLAIRWMDAMGVDIAMSFATPMLHVAATHPVPEIVTALAWAYNRWLVEEVLAEEPRLRSMLYLPFTDPEECYKMVMAFRDRPGVSGFLVPTTSNVPVHDNSMMKTYAALQERNLPIAFHAGQNWHDHSYKTNNKFISVHALSFVFYNMVHLTNWVINGMPERFPDLKVIWMESGLAWIPFMMQRLDNEYMMRSSECPLLRKRPSHYMRERYYSSQPMEVPENPKALELTFEMINAETQLMYSSDYPHWDFDLPGTIFDLPFLTDTARRNILGETAGRVFNIERPAMKLAKIPGPNETFTD